MSFRRRGEIVEGGRTDGYSIASRASAQLSGRQTGTASAQLSGRQTGTASAQTGLPLRGALAKPPARGVIPPQRHENDSISAAAMNPGIRPSLITSQSTTSTGCLDLDKILLHQGLPLGHSLLIEESGTTDFASVLLRGFASQGIMHNRSVSHEHNQNQHPHQHPHPHPHPHQHQHQHQHHYSHVIVLGMSSSWANDLPGVYKGTSKEQKKAKIAENESKVSVSNIAFGSSGNRNDSKMKIAWRYGLNKKDEGEEDSNSNSKKGGRNKGRYENYSHQFDITQRLTPGPTPQDISFVPLTHTVNGVISALGSIIQAQLKSNRSKVIRLVIPGFLNPSIYPRSFSEPTFVFPFVHSLRSLLRQFESNLVLISSLALDLYPRSSNLTGVLESLFDASIHLQPFNQEMSAMIERTYKNEPSKIQQGLVNIVKIPVLSEKGLMMVHDGEYAFKNDKKRFKIEPWSIPVEDDSKETNSILEGAQTKKDIDF
ncbi:ELP4 [Candida oxycetoniae]|uniref:Elongator complex protein 4 n=1 Tax=Candida oxycetoniae TaxID=497107 RepID=A0AAI9SUC8_9ASCO|nr:ELP4 [Candida oxycetoniae]KAI3402988.2 ELP4 [Candida oxycetoniae]